MPQPHCDTTSASAVRADGIRNDNPSSALPSTTTNEMISSPSDTTIDVYFANDHVTILACTSPACSEADPTVPRSSMWYARKSVPQLCPTPLVKVLRACVPTASLRLILSPASSSSRDRVHPPPSQAHHSSIRAVRDTNTALHRPSHNARTARGATVPNGVKSWHPRAVPPASLGFKGTPQPVRIPTALTPALPLPTYAAESATVNPLGGEDAQCLVTSAIQADALLSKQNRSSGMRTPSVCDTALSARAHSHCVHGWMNPSSDPSTETKK
ncbi:hypothetical protein R3P38DRAFT_3200025 [Favolaschia claudopus]|uniref:Uncharacterized protein n=1 Tax=Favolaschia claudopus TaxID=2862362 RepID=A0AAW0B0X8_9AGAR